MAALPELTEIINSNFMTCGLCGATYNNPIILPCLHSACTDCLQRYVADEKKDAVNARSSSTLDQGTKHPCPVCKTTDFVWNAQDEQPANGVLPNHFLCGLQDLAQCQGKQEQSCDYCRHYESKTVEATSRCLECQDSLCCECAEAHRKTKLTRAHTVAPFTQIQQGKYDSQVRAHHRVPCNRHADQGVSFHCTKCKTLVCRECKVTTHADHHCEDMDQLGAKGRERIGHLVETIRTKMPSVQRFIGSLEEYEERVTKNKDELTAQIKYRSEKLHKAIDEHKEKLLNKVNSASHAELETTNQKKSNVEHMQKQLCDATEYVNVLIEHGKSEEILSVKRLVTTRLNQLAQVSLPPMETKLNIHYQPGTCNDQAMKNIFGRITIRNDALKEEAGPDITMSNNYDSIDTEEFSTFELNRENEDANDELPKIAESIELMKSFECKSALDTKDIWPTGLAISSKGEAFVVDRENKTVKVYDLEGTLLNVFGKDSLGTPYDITTMPDGSVAVTDYDAEDVKIFTPEGALIQTIKKLARYPRGISSSSGHLLVVDCHSRRLIFLDPATEQVVRAIQGPGEDGCDLFTDPYYVTTNRDGSIIVTDWAAPNIKIFSPEGHYVTKYGTYGVHKDQVLQPYGVCTDRYGYIFVADNRNHRIHLLAPDGKFLQFVVNKDHGLWHPMAIAINPEGHLVVTEALGKVKVFKYL